MAWLGLMYFYLFNLIWINESAKTMGPVGQITINSIYECKEKPAVDIGKLHVELKNVDDKGTKALFATYESKITVDKTYIFAIKVDKWEAGNWKTFYTYKGSLCVDLDKHIPKLWGKLKAQLKPALTQTCPMKPGKYTLEGFQASSKDFTIPVIFYGKMRLRISVLKDGKLGLCVEGEGDSQAPA